MKQKVYAKTIEDKIEKYVTVNSETECWEWTGAKTFAGYGRTGYRGKAWMVHRLLYTHYKGPIPKGLVLDHLCRNPSCCNPAHLEAVTQKENTIRGNTGSKNAKKTECPYGHYIEGVRSTGGRYCRVCKAYKKQLRDGGHLSLEEYTLQYNKRKAGGSKK